MEEFFVDLLLSDDRLKGAILGAILGSIAAVLGGGVGELLTKIFKKEKITLFIIIIFIFISLQIPHLIKPYVLEKYGKTYKENLISENVVSELKKNRLYNVIFRIHPEAEKELSDKLQDIIFKTPERDVMYLSQLVSSEIVAKYYQKHLPAASNENTHKLLERNVKFLRMFQNKPELCVSYYMGQPKFRPEDLPLGFIEEESDFKADIIESAIRSPSVPPKAGGIEEILEVIIRAYQEKGYALENIEKLDYLMQIPADEACDVAIEFSDVLASFDMKQGAFVFKNLLYLAEQ